MTSIVKTLWWIAMITLMLSAVTAVANAPQEDVVELRQSITELPDCSMREVLLDLLDNFPKPQPDGTVEVVPATKFFKIYRNSESVFCAFRGYAAQHTTNSVNSIKPLVKSVYDLVFRRLEWVESAQNLTPDQIESYKRIRNTYENMALARKQVTEADGSYAKIKR